MAEKDDGGLEKGLFSIPREMRHKIDELAADALFDTRNDETFEIDAQKAALRTVDMLMAQAPDMVWSLMRNGLTALVGRRVLALIEQSKKAYTQQVVDAGEKETYHDIVDRCYLEIVSYRLAGRNTAVKKYLGDMTLAELHTIHRQYAEKRLRFGRRANRFKAIADWMEEHGADADTRVSDIFKDKPEANGTEG